MGMRNSLKRIALGTACVALSATAYVQEASAALKVASWNLNIFNPTKAANADVVDAMANTIKAYDLILLQEIRDPNDTSIRTLFNKVNAKTSNAYAMQISDRVGSTNSKEQYAYFYRKGKLTFVDGYHYMETASTTFNREPFVTRWSTTQATVTNFFVIPLHADPSSVNAELGSLVSVYNDAVSKLKISNGVIMGSLNAGCSYLSDAQRSTNPLFTDARFSLLIPNSSNSAVSTSAVCPYERAFAAGTLMVANAAQGAVADLLTRFGWTQTFMQTVSDRYPVEFVIN